jgi:hypothetical protein
MGSLLAHGGPLLRGAILASAGAVGYRLGVRAGRRKQPESDADPRAAPGNPSPDGLAGHSVEGAAQAVESAFVVAELERLARLFDQGALNQPEFEAAKRELLEEF